MISLDKQYRTRDGRKVRIYATDGGASRDWIHGAIFHDGYWSSMSWCADGKKYSWREDDLDLIEVRPRIKRTYWVNIYPVAYWTIDLYATKEKADGHAGHSRIACVKVEIDCEHGEGL